MPEAICRVLTCLDTASGQQQLALVHDCRLFVLQPGVLTVFHDLPAHMCVNVNYLHLHVWSMAG